MTWDDQPTRSAETPPETAGVTITRRQAQQGPVHRTVLTAILGAALLVAGVVAVVAAASPDPSGSPAPAASDDSSTSGTTERSQTGERHDGRPCPNDETDGSGGSDDGSGGSDGGQSADPSPSAETPAT